MVGACKSKDAELEAVQRDVAQMESVLEAETAQLTTLLAEESAGSTTGAFPYNP